MKLCACVVETRANASKRFLAGRSRRHAARDEMLDAIGDDRFQLGVGLSVDRWTP
jgi:hypothetical protein